MVSDITAFLFFLCLLTFLIALIKPSWVVRWGEQRTRRAALIYYFFPAVLFMIISVATFTPKVNKNVTAQGESDMNALLIVLLLGVGIVIAVKVLKSLARKKTQTHTNFEVKKSTPANISHDEEKQPDSIVEVDLENIENKESTGIKQTVPENIDNHPPQPKQKNKPPEVNQISSKPAPESKIKSESDKSIIICYSGVKKYEIDIENRTCTCPDWRKKRSVYYPGEPMRLCKHLIKEIVKHDLQDEYGSESRRIEYAAKKGIGYYPRKNEQNPDLQDDNHTPQGRRKILGRLFDAKVSAKEEEKISKAFGGDGYIFNITMYLSRTNNGSVTLHAPRGDYYRWRLEAMTRSGVVKQGEDIKAEHLLEGLKMGDLRGLNKAYGFNLKFRTKKEGCEKLARKIPNVANYLPDGYYIDDFFRLEELTIDDIRNNWS
jgi:hypothetical protein